MNSENTSRKQIPRIFHQITPKDNDLVLDYGGGKFDKGLDHLKNKFPKTNFVLYDPFNRPDFYNQNTLEIVKENHGVNIGILSNVLNVIPQKKVRKKILYDLYSLLKPNGEIFISVYNANRTEKYKETENIVGQPTIFGWQNCQEIEFFEGEILEFFKIKNKKRNLISGVKK